MDKKDLINFNKEIVELYEQGKIHSPVHLHGGNEDALIGVFKNFKQGDWVFSTHRSHYHWLLAGKDPEELKKQILEGHSMHIFGEKFLTSAIVSGIAPIAVGVAKAIEAKGLSEHVWCFLGDMAASGGLVSECIRYSIGWNLPITFIVEDNCMSVRACTQDVWGKEKSSKVLYYKYIRTYPHSGTGKYIMF